MLLAEDDLLIGEVVMMHLRAEGYTGNWVKSGADVLPRIWEYRPDVLVLDIGLPVSSGFEILAAISKHPPLSNINILVLTARHAYQDVKLALTLGADDYMTKPFAPQKLVKRIERLLTTKRAVPSPARPGLPPVLLPDEAALGTGHHESD